MARSDNDRVVQPSLLDRLTDEFPRESSDRATTFEASASAFRASVKSDLNALLNTRRTIVQATADQSEVRNSVHQFGLPDISGRYSFSNLQGRQQLAQDILEAIQRFEPRLTSVKVVLTDQNPGHIPQLRFSISATLLMDPSPEQIVFDTVLEVASGMYQVGEGN